MAKRKWIAKWSMGYVGTDQEEEIDLIDDFGYSEEHLEAVTDVEASSEVSDYARERAMEMIDYDAVPADED